MQLKQKFFLIFSVLVIAPVLLLSYLVYAGYRDMVNERVQDTADNIMEQAVLKTNDTFEDLEHILEVVQTDSPITRRSSRSWANIPAARILIRIVTSMRPTIF